MTGTLSRYGLAREAGKVAKVLVRCLVQHLIDVVQDVPLARQQHLEAAGLVGRGDKLADDLAAGSPKDVYSMFRAERYGIAPYAEAELGPIGRGAAKERLADRVGSSLHLRHNIGTKADRKSV